MSKTDTKLNISELKNIINGFFNKEVYKLVFSKPANPSAHEKRVTIDLLPDYYQMTKFAGTKVFHSKLTYEEAESETVKLLGAQFLCLTAWDGLNEHTVSVTSGGKVFYRKKSERKSAVNAPKKRTAHNKVKAYILEEGIIIPPLIDMGVFTPKGALIKSMSDKYRQINKFLEIIEDELSEWDRSKELKIIDFGCGKSYLTYVLYYYFTEIKRFKVRMVGLDLKEDVIRTCNEAAEKYGYTGLRFEMGSIVDYKCDFPVDMVVSLHACDTATDYALFNAVCWDAKYIFSVPCCQHELSLQMESADYAIFTRYGIIKERLSAIMTDSIRANMLICCDYKAQVMEFVDLSHTPKNLLIRAVKCKQPKAVKEKANDEIKQLIDTFNITPTIWKLLNERYRLMI